MSTTRKVKELSDIASRTSCPRCEGFGWVHDTLEKHDKPDSKTRCKRCSNCAVCEGSGVVTGKLPCKPCKSRGFIHPVSTHLREHNTLESIKCSDCIECRECFGEGVVSAKKSASKIKSSSSGSATKTTSASQTARPVSLAIDPSNPTSSLPTEKTPTQVDKVDFEVLAAEITPEELGISPSACPRCDGRGWRHESSIKHDKAPSTRCKNCTSCKCCQSLGKLLGKTTCPSCSALGFTHDSQERSHDAPIHLRCFFCKDCRTCLSLGVVDSKELMMARKAWVVRQKRKRREMVRALKADEKAKQLRDQQQMGLQQQGHGMTPHVPVPPALPVVMVKQGDGTLVPSVNIPGVGLVPAEQVLRMKIPMAPASVIPLSTVMPSGSDASVSLQSLPGVTTLGSSSDKEAQSTPGGMDIEEREAVLRDVWG